mmetsp:Transcript_103282/g.296500  ORF Transcript_103282/g.296500 Transcript_103282/m.296500 type:complete len:202 (-) Transcript_103282:330-935(-)
MRRRPDRPNVRQPLPSQRHVTGDVALLLADEVLGLVQRLVREAMDLHLRAEDVGVRDLVRGQEGARLHVPHGERTACGHGLPLHLEAQPDVRVEELPLRLATGGGEGRDLLVPGEFRGGQCGDHLAVHVGWALQLRTEWCHDHAEELCVVHNIIVEAVVFVAPFNDEGVPDCRLIIQRGGQHEGRVVLRNLIVWVDTQVPL